MGTDIHAFVEGKINGKWHYLGFLDIGRDYELFGVLSNVRADWAWNRYDLDGQLAIPGFPDGLSTVGMLIVRLWDKWGNHNPGWLPEDRIHKLFEVLQEMYGHDRQRQVYSFGGWCLPPEGGSLYELLTEDDYRHIATEYRLVISYDS